MDTNELVSAAIRHISTAIDDDSNHNTQTIFDICHLFNQHNNQNGPNFLLRALRAYLKNNDALSQEIDIELLFHIATFNTNKGRADLAIPIFKSILSMSDKHPEAFKLVVPEILIKYGSACLSQEDYPSAIHQFKTAIEKARLNGNALQVAHAENNLALCYIRSGTDYDVRTLLESSYSVRVRELGEHDLDTIATNINLISCCFNAGDTTTSITKMKTLEQSIKVHHGEGVIEYTNVCSLLGEWSVQIGNYQDAKEYYNREINALELFGAMAWQRIESAKFKLSQIDNMHSEQE